MIHIQSDGVNEVLLYYTSLDEGFFKFDFHPHRGLGNIGPHSSRHVTQGFQQLIPGPHVPKPEEELRTLQVIP